MRFKPSKIPEFTVLCPKCGISYRTSNWDLAYRCKDCGEETEIWFPEEYGE